MLVLFIDQFGMDALHWHPQTIREEVEQHFGVQLPRHNQDRLMAAVTVVTTDLFFNSLPRFIQICNVLSGEEFDPTTFDPADSAECAWGCTEALLLDPPDEDNSEPFCDEIRHYIAEVLKDEGYVTAPDILKIAIGVDLSSQVSYDFADDPEMFQGIYAVQQSRTEEVEDILKKGLLELVGQLKALPLRNGSTADLEKRISAMIREAAEKPLT